MTGSADHRPVSAEQAQSLYAVTGLPDDAFDRLVQSLGEELRPSTRMDIVYRVSTRVPELEAPDVSRVVDALMSLRLLQRMEDTPELNLAEAAAQAIGIGSDASDRSVLVGRLQRLLSAPAIAAMAKASDVVSEHSQTFRDARIMTDIRPVFTGDPEDDPNSVVIVHTLKIEYQEGHDSRSFYVALGTTDLAKLQDVIDRARAKSQSFGRLLSSRGISSLDPKEDRREDLGRRGAP